MKGPAVIKLRDKRECFEATSAEIVGPFVHATGRERRRTGPDWSETLYSAERTVSWPARQVMEIQWLA